MAGGAGSRLRPITIERPKPMITVVNKPAIAHILNLLKQNGITETVITVQYMANIIQDYFGDGSNLGMKITYCVEEDPLGTAGGVKHVQSLLDDTFVVVSGDAITDFNLQDIVRFHRQKQAKATITLYRVPDPLEFGVIVTNAQGYITQFLEKPTWGEVISDTVNTGIYVLEPEILDHIPDNQPFDFSNDLFPKLLARQTPLAGYVAGGYWCDIGSVSSLRQATADMLEGKVSNIALGTHIGGNIWVGGEVDIAPTATLLGPIYLGKSVRIKDNAVIRGPTIVRDYSIVEERAQIDRSIVWRNCYIGKGVELRGAVVLRHCSLKSKSVVYEGAVIGDGSIIGEGAVIHPNVKVWAGKEIEPGATIKNSVIWGSQGRRVLFGRHGVAGMVNVDFSPEFSAKLGAAFGATLPKGSLVTFNRDPHRSPRMLKRAAIAGLPSAGVQVADIGVQPIPVARYFTRVSAAVGGIYVRLSPFDQMVVNMRFLDERGLNISKEAERKIERVFFREDFRRVFMDEIGTINNASQVLETYTQGFLKVVNAGAIQAANFNLVIDYASSP
ncbi:MAG: sugar phosphate nucleotidyltransferase, partial [Anaerolineae bacterium]